VELKEKQEKYQKLRDKIAACTRCSLHETRTNTVPGEGDICARIMFIGEAPGKNEDEQGIPFIGRAGKIFDQLLESIGLTREQIYLCNILKCRPPGNRNPLSTEIAACIGSLDLQIKLINPEVIGTLGNFSTTYIFEKFSMPLVKISSVAGRVINVDTPFGKKKIVPLFHPAVATYSPKKIEILLEHFQVFKDFLGERKEEEAPQVIKESQYQAGDLRDQKELF